MSNTDVQDQPAEVESQLASVDMASSGQGTSVLPLTAKGAGGPSSAVNSLETAGNMTGLPQARSILHQEHLADGPS